MSTALSNPDENRGPQILSAVVFTTSLALITVCARIFTRLRLFHMFGADDWMIIVATVLSIVGLGLVAGQVSNGAGQHVGDLDPAVNMYGMLLNFVSRPIYIWAISMVKMSVGIFLLRITPNQFYRNILLTVISFVVACTLLNFLAVILQCKDISALWDFTVKTTCWPASTTMSMSYVNSALNILTDLFFAMIPVLMLWNDQMKPDTKASLICILGLGVFASAAAIIRTTFLANYGETGDSLWDSANLTIWTAIELNTGIIAACLPTLKPPFTRLLETSLCRPRTSGSKYGDSHPIWPYVAGFEHAHHWGGTAKDGSATGLPAGASALRHGRSGSTAHAFSTSGSRRQNSVKSSLRPFRKLQTQSQLSENSSQESILSMSSQAGEGSGITKTTVVVVNSTGPADPATPGASQGRSMWHGSDAV